MELMTNFRFQHFLFRKKNVVVNSRRNLNIMKSSENKPIFLTKQIVLKNKRNSQMNVQSSDSDAIKVEGHSFSKMCYSFYVLFLAEDLV